MSQKFLICTDLDRTLLPNGEPPESPRAREYFSRLAQHPEVDIAYVTGRHKALVFDAITDYHLPQPDYILADVGSSIYTFTADTWHPWQAWENEIAPCWKGYKHDQLAGLFTGINILTLQEPEKQNVYKLSYYLPLDSDVDTIMADMQTRLQEKEIRASLIWSIDEQANIGLLDLLPANATKLHAIEFLMRQQGYQPERTLFAGDSGNDLAVLASDINAVLVANAAADVREQANQMSIRQRTTEHLYLARGGFMGMNGNYAAGILEGLDFFMPEMRPWLAEINR